MNLTEFDAIFVLFVEQWIAEIWQELEWQSQRLSSITQIFFTCCIVLYTFIWLPWAILDDISIARLFSRKCRNWIFDLFLVIKHRPNTLECCLLLIIRFYNLILDSGWWDAVSGHFWCVHIDDCNCPQLQFITYSGYKSLPLMLQVNMAAENYISAM